MIQWSHGITVHKCVVLFYFGGVRNGLQLDRSEYRLAVDVCDVVSHMAYRELCIILQVCICLVSERLRQTELMDAQLTVMIVLVHHEYLLSYMSSVLGFGAHCILVFCSVL
jgi:hypothetical protein